MNRMFSVLFVLLNCCLINAAASESKLASPAVNPKKFNEKGLFECTHYYTIKESGCYNWTSSTQLISISGVSRWVNELFKACVQLEGMGKLLSPIVVSGVSYNYVGFDNGVYTAYSQPLGSKSIPLKKGVSCAADIKASHGSPLKIESKVVVWKKGSTAIFDTFGTYLFKVDDVGGGINFNHFDLYWGEDDPRGGTPGSTAALAKTCPYDTQQGNSMAMSK